MLLPLDERQTIRPEIGPCTPIAGPPALYPFGYNKVMRPIRFLGDSLRCLRDFPQSARPDAGYQLDKVQDLKIAKIRFGELLGGKI